MCNVLQVEYNGEDTNYMFDVLEVKTAGTTISSRMNLIKDIGNIEEVEREYYDEDSGRIPSSYTEIEIHEKRPLYVLSERSFYDISTHKQLLDIYDFWSDYND